MKKRNLIIVVVAIGIGIVVAHSHSAEKVAAQPYLFTSGTQDEIEVAKSIGRSVLRDRMESRRLGRPDEFLVTKAVIDDLKFAHVRFRQTIGGVPVWRGEAIVHLDATGAVRAITDDTADVSSVDIVPVLTPDEAVGAAVRLYDGSAFLTAEPVADLWICPTPDGSRLAYRVQMRREDGTQETAMPVIFVDAHTAEKVFEYDNLQTGTGTSLYNGRSVIIDTSIFRRTYYMEDLTRRMGTVDMRSTTNSPIRFTDADDRWTASNHRAGVDAHYAAARFYDYFFTTFGREGLDGNRGPGSIAASANSSVSLLQSRVHYGFNYNNAFWNGVSMTYGDGDGAVFGPLVSVDIGAHELMHGVTQYTAELIYQGESGALNESISDVFSSLVERYTKGESANTWKLGEQAYTPGNGTSDALRYLDNPHLAPNSGFTSDDDPDHYAERYIGSQDNGGVHVNSGIGNKAFYMLARGGTHHRSEVTVTAIGPEDAGAIWYRALTTYMTTGTDYEGAREATLLAAADLFTADSQQYDSTADAWCAVGIGACSGTPSIGVSPTSLSFTGLEGGASPPGQTLTIENIGGAILNWSATDDVTWLTVSPVSGTAPSSPLVNINTAGLAPGSYFATITVTAAAADNSPVLVPVSLTIDPVPPSVIANGGFEGSVTPWVVSGTGAFYTSNGNYPRSGTGYIYLGQNNSATGQVYQQISIPANAYGDLRFWLNVTSSETTTTTQYDRLFVEVRNTSGTLLATVRTYSNLDKTTAGNYSQRSLNVAAYRGQTVRVQFRATTDNSLPTTFRVDDVSIY